MPPMGRLVLASSNHNHGRPAQAIRLEASQPTHNHGNQTQAIRQDVCQPLAPANSALAGIASQVGSSSSSASYQPFSFSDWELKQIHEFVSIDSLLVVYVQDHTGELDSEPLGSKATSPTVHVA